MRLSYAREVAGELTVQLQPHTSKFNLAGSIRREKPEVKDIEIVCLPRIVQSDQADLFGAKVANTVISPGFISTVALLGKVLKGKPGGRYMQIELNQGPKLDLFMPAPEDYYRQYAIRTGSAEYARQTIAKAWLKKGWCGSDKGLRKISDCTEHISPVDGKRSWLCVNPNAERPPAWACEQEFFEWIGVPCIMPKLRTI